MFGYGARCAFSTRVFLNTQRTAIAKSPQKSEKMMLLLWWPFQLNTVLASFSIATLFLRHQLFCCEIEILSDTPLLVWLKRGSFTTARIVMRYQFHTSPRNRQSGTFWFVQNGDWAVESPSHWVYRCKVFVTSTYGDMIWNVWLEKQSRSSFEAFDMSIKRENTNSEQDNRWYWGRYCPWTMLYCSNEKLVKTCVSQKWTKVVARFFSC